MLDVVDLSTSTKVMVLGWARGGIFFNFSKRETLSQVALDKISHPTVVQTFESLGTGICTTESPCCSGSGALEYQREVYHSLVSGPAWTCLLDVGL